MLTDTHLHTCFSPDGSDTPSAIAAAALGRNLGLIALTDHYDGAYGHEFDFAAYFQGLETARLQYYGQLRVLSGLELGEPHLYPEKIAQVSGMDFDFFLASVHKIDDRFLDEPSLVEDFGMEGFARRYYQVMLEMVSAGGFDNLAHLDFPLRFHPHFPFLPHQILDVLKVLVGKGMALEINTSSWRKGMGFSNPDRPVLELYRQAGGRMVTIGSDAHEAASAGGGIDYALALCTEFGLTPGYFARHRFTEA